MSSTKDTLECPYFESGRCRSCTLLGTQASEVPLPLFDEALAALSPRLGDWRRAPSAFHSRTKAKLSVTGDVDSPRLGILDADLQGVELLDCPLHLPLINSCLHLLKELLPKHRIPPYRIAERTGELKGLIIQCNQAASHCLVRFVARSGSVRDSLRRLSEELQTRLGAELSGVELSTSLNIQAIPHQILEGPEEFGLLGPELLWEDYAGVQVAFPPQSFMQVTPSVATQLYQAATEAFRRRALSSALDLYCGAGGFALHLGNVAKRVLGVELREASVRAASQAAERNGFSHVSFLAAGVDDSLEVLQTQSFDAIVCNPPRRGLSQALLIQLCAQNPAPKLLLYSSCNPVSLRKDLSQLLQHYTLVELTPFEMFPLTSHYEILAVLERK